MEPFTFDDLDRCRVDVEAAADVTLGIDPWCSGPDWQVSVATGFAPNAPRLLLAGSDCASFALLARYRSDDGSALISGLEPLWGFGSPLLGPDPGALATELAAELAADPSWSTILLPGLPPIRQPDAPNTDGPADQPTDGPASHLGQPSDGGALTTLPIAVALSSLGRVGFGEGITRQVIDLAGGHEAWLARRSPKFRRNLRRAERAATDVGLTIVDVSTDPDVFDRLLTIERHSWKGREESGITGPEMTAMYRTMIARLGQRRRLLAHVAVLDGNDVGYILGGLRARRYRGLQISYTDDATHLSVGNLLQANQLALLSDNDQADLYDLGMDFGYKARWADRAETSVLLVVQR